MKKNKFLALTGGVGGAKLCLGLQQILPATDCAFVVNVGDDFSHYGLHISPDIDTLTYTLAGLSNPDTGWGRRGETWHFIETMKTLGAESWFNLGDADLALHVYRTELLKQGMPLGEITAKIAALWQIEHAILPVSNDPVPTLIDTAQGRLPFQEYFVRQKCEPAVNGFEFDGAREARLNPSLESWLADPALAGIIICPSNPFISVDPILTTANFGNIINGLNVPVVAVSPIIAGAAVKGPTAKIMQELKIPNTAQSVAAHYQELIDGFVVDLSDRSLVSAIEALGIDTITEQTLMITLADKITLARAVLGFVRRLGTE